MTNGSTAVLDRERALERLDGDEELYREIIQVFLEDVPQQVEKLKTALKDDEAQAAGRQAHSLKSAAGNIGAEVVRELAYKMEHAGKKGELESLNTLFAELERALEGLSKRIEELGLMPV